MIVFGGRASKIGKFEVSKTTCKHCGDETIQEISVFGKFAHIFWIPIFPIGKKAVAECVDCKRTIEQREFSPELKELYKANKSKTKRPIWHWAGLLLVGILIALLTVIIATNEGDSRTSLFSEDALNMSRTSTMETDSISYKIKQVFDNFANDELLPEKFKYLTKIQGEKALILVQIPKLRKVEKEARSEALEMIEMITDNQADLANKELYIGVRGVVTTMIVKTPSYEMNSKLALQSKLYDFYGPKVETKN